MPNLPIPPKPEPEPLPDYTETEWAALLAKALHTALRKSDLPTVRECNKLLEQYHATHKP